MTAAPPPDEGRPGDSLTWPDGTHLEIVIPDDISELQPEVDAWRREQRAADAHPGFLQRIAGSLHHYGATTPLLIMSMLLVGAFSAALVLFSPRGLSRTMRAAAPLATTTVAPGQAGGLLPDTTLATIDGGVVGARSLRPAVLLLVPAGCSSCSTTIQHLVALSEPYHLLSYVVSADKGLVAKQADVSSKEAGGLIDRTGTFISSLTAHPQRVAFVAVASNGVIRTVVDDVSSDARVLTALEGVISPSATAGT